MEHWRKLRILVSVDFRDTDAIWTRVRELVKLYSGTWEAEITVDGAHESITIHAPWLPSDYATKAGQAAKTVELDTLEDVVNAAEALRR